MNLRRDDKVGGHGCCSARLSDSARGKEVAGYWRDVTLPRVVISSADMSKSQKSGELSLKKGDILTERQLDDAVHQAQLHALGLGMIPIAGIMSRRRGDDRHEVVGFGWNHLREGIPGIHGETGAIMNMGRIEGGYS